ncbi:MAG: hypothetical protein IIU43_11190, partial [Thermoguttaceae bacterium]|nr:hypothetical protein [Thermoguttaceae bacterium]
MSVRFRLQCSQCGKDHPVELRQAGGAIDCECGAKVQIPTMLKIKRLPPWEDDATKQLDAQTTVANPADDDPKNAQNVDAKPDAASETAANGAEQQTRAPRRGLAVSAGRRAVFALACVAFILNAFLCARLSKTPDPREVFYRDTTYAIGDGKRVRRDATPVSMDDYSFYFVTDFSDPKRTTYLVNERFIDVMPPFDAYRFFDLVKSPELSDNFYENYGA